MALLNSVFAILSFCAILNAQNCSNNKYNDTIKKAKCKPRDTLVSFNGSENLLTFIPDRVVVKRCDGYASGMKTCQPYRMNNVTIPVKKIIGNKLVCEMIVVEQHLSCRSICLVTKQSCTEKQKYQPMNCACVCKDQDKKEKECINQGKILNKSSCSCVCENVEECSSTTIWSDSMCSCIDENHHNRKYAHHSTRNS